MPHGRAAFTLVELLVVVAIIGILVGLILPAVEAVRGKAKIMNARNDIYNLSNAIANFKSTYQVPYLTDQIWFFDPNNPANPDPELIRIWPRWNMANGKPTTYNGWGIDPANGNPKSLEGNQCLVFLLGGYRVQNNGAPPIPTYPQWGGLYGGFSAIASSPFYDPPQSPPNPNNIPFSGKVTGPFMDIQPSRINQNGYFLDPWGQPYVYFTSKYGNDYNPSLAVRFPKPVPAGSTVYPYKDISGKFVNQNGFQIICAGPDGMVGPGSGGPSGIPSPIYNPPVPPFGPAWTPGNNLYAKSGPGNDDIANFWDKPLGAP